MEAAKFALYIAAPVVAFWYYHRIENFENRLAHYYKNTYTRKEKENNEMIKEFRSKVNRIRMKEFEKMEKELEAKKSNED